MCGKGSSAHVSPDVSWTFIQKDIECSIQMIEFLTISATALFIVFIIVNFYLCFAAEKVLKEKGRLNNWWVLGIGLIGLGIPAFIIARRIKAGTKNSQKKNKGMPTNKSL